MVVRRETAQLTHILLVATVASSSTRRLFGFPSISINYRKSGTQVRPQFWQTQMQLIGIGMKTNLGVNAVSGGSAAF